MEKPNGAAKAPPIIQPKPKGGNLRKLEIQPAVPPKPTRGNNRVNGRNHTSSDEEEDPGSIRLNPDSLAQFSKVDLDAVKRYQMLDSEAQRQKAHLSHGLGLQNRRLPSGLVSKVGEDYYDRRKSYDPIAMATPSTPKEELLRTRSKTYNDDNYDTMSVVSCMTPEEREKKIMAKAGVTGGMPAAGLAQIFRSRGSKNTKLARSASGGSKDRESPPQVKAKPSKNPPVTGSPDLSKVKSASSSPSLRGSFKLFKRKKKLNKDGDDVSRGSCEDLYSETSSLSSLSRVSIREEELAQDESPSPLIVASTPNHTPSQSLPEPESSPTVSPTHNTSGVSQTSSIFKEKDMPSLFDKEDEKNKGSLFDTSELDKLLAKTQTEFGAKGKTEEEEIKDSDKKDDKEAKPKQDEYKLKPQSPDKKLSVGSRIVPNKPTRKSRTSLLDLRAYDRAATEAIQATKEREQERKEKAQAKVTTKTDTKTLGLFDEVAEEEDALFSTKKDSPKKEHSKKDSPKTELLRKESPKEEDEDEDLFKSSPRPAKKDSPKLGVSKKDSPKKEPVKKDLSKKTSNDDIFSDVKIKSSASSKETTPSKEATPSPILGRRDPKVHKAAERKAFEDLMEKTKKEDSKKEEKEKEKEREKKEKEEEKKKKEREKREKEEEEKKRKEREKREKEEEERKKKEREKKEKEEEEKKQKEREKKEKEEREKKEREKKEKEEREKKEREKKEKEEREKKEKEEREKKEKEEREKNKQKKDPVSKLFEDDDDDDDIFSTKKETSKPDSKIDDIFGISSDKKDKDKPATSKKYKLFDSGLDDEEDDLFSDTKPEEKPKKTDKGDTMKELFGDDKERFASKLQSSSETKVTVADSKTAIEKESEEREKKKHIKDGSSSDLFGEDDGVFDDTKSVKPSVTKRAPSKERSPLSSKPPVPNKPQRISLTSVTIDIGKEKKAFSKSESGSLSPVAKVEDKTSDTKDVTIETKTRAKSETKQDSEKKDDDKKEDVPAWKRRLEERRKEREKEATQTKKTEKTDQKTEEVPAWKKRMEERRLQREQESKKQEEKKDRKDHSSDKKDSDDVPAWKKKLEERKKQRESEFSKTDTSTSKATEDPSSTEKIKTKPPPITTTTSDHSGDLKVPKSPNPTTPTSDRESSPITPTIDPSLPKWKQDLLARKKTGGTAPVSPRKSEPDKEESIPAWKKDLLAKREGGASRPSGSSSAGGRGQQKEVPAFMKEFQQKKRN